MARVLAFILFALTMAGCAHAAASIDALGNIRNRTEGTNSVSTMNYNATNRVSTATIFGQSRTFTYDARGNVTNNGRYAFVYDFANQPVTQTGAVNATYAYDGNLKRVKEVRFLARVFYGEPLRTSPENAWGGKTIYNVYSRLTGSLVYRDEATDAKTTDYVAVVTPRSRISLTASRLNSSLCVLRLPMIASGLSKTPYLGVLQTGGRPVITNQADDLVTAFPGRP